MTHGTLSKLGLISTFLIVTGVTAWSHDLGWSPVVVTGALGTSEEREPFSEPEPAPTLDWRDLPPLQPKLVNGPTPVRTAESKAAPPALAPIGAAKAAPKPPPPPGPAHFNAPMPSAQSQPIPAGADPKRATNALPPNARPAQQYCYNIADSARDARFSLQKKKLEELEQQLQERIGQLDAKTKEYQNWLARRDEFSRKAEENLVRIYTRMRPDAASAQLIAMDDETAAAVLSKLDPRRSSAILNEMDAKEAATLSTVMAASANKALPKKRTPRPAVPATPETAAPTDAQAAQPQPPAPVDAVQPGQKNS